MIVARQDRHASDGEALALPYIVRVYGVTDEMFDEMTDEDTKAELLDREMIVHSPASMRHDMLGNFLRALFGAYTEEKDLGAIYGPDCLARLRRGRRFAPELFFVVAPRVPRPTPQEFNGVPDLIVEVLSPSNRGYDLGEKRSAYREAGVPEIWFVDPRDEEVLIDRKRRKTYATETISTGRAASTVLTGFWLDSAWLWADPPPKLLRCLRTILK